MKRLLIVLAILSLLVSVQAFSKDKELTLTWTQTLPTPNDLKGWNVYFSDNPLGPYRFVEFVPFVRPSATYSYTIDKIPTFNLKKKADLFFCVASVDEEGNVSSYSATTSLQVDDAPSGDVTAPPVPGAPVVTKK